MKKGAKMCNKKTFNGKKYIKVFSTKQIKHWEDIKVLKNKETNQELKKKLFR